MSATDEQTPHWQQAFIALGSNLGDRPGHLRAALAALTAHPGIRPGRLSTVHETEPCGGPPQPCYLNAALELWTELPPADLLAALLEIEARLGRVRTVRFGPRTIDLDLLLYGDRCIGREELTVPHPRMLERRFVLEPLNEIAGGIRHPGTGKTVSQLLAELLARQRAGV